MDQLLADPRLEFIKVINERHGEVSVSFASCTNGDWSAVSESGSSRPAKIMVGGAGYGYGASLYEALEQALGDWGYGYWLEGGADERSKSTEGV